MHTTAFVPPRPARASDFPIFAIPIETADSRLIELRHLVASIRDNLDAAGVGPFSDIPELARAAVLCRVAERVAVREVRS